MTHHIDNFSYFIPIFLKFSLVANGKAHAQWWVTLGNNYIIRNVTGEFFELEVVCL